MTDEATGSSKSNGYNAEVEGDESFDTVSGNGVDGSHDDFGDGHGLRSNTTSNATEQQQQKQNAEREEDSFDVLSGGNDSIDNDSDSGELTQKSRQQYQTFVPGISQSMSSDADESSDDQFSDSDMSADDDGGLDNSGKGRRRRRNNTATSGGHRENRLAPYENLTETQSLGLNFAMEHRIFLRALLGLLNEREKTATETGMNDPNILKSGPLKKASHLVSGVWKVKYVEIRRGMLTYFEDVPGGGPGGGGGGGGGGGTGGGLNANIFIDGRKGSPESLLQKNIPLDSNECICRPVKIHRNGLNMAPGASIFELKVGNTGRLWLTRSRAERASWIQAINDAMVGGSVTQGNAASAHGKFGTVDSRSPYRQDLRLYLKTKSSLKHSKTKEDYLSALSVLAGRTELSIPVRWIMLQVENTQGISLSRNTSGVGSDDECAFKEADISHSVDQLWRDLRRDSIRINDKLFLGDNGHGPELIVGALTRDIVTTSRSESNRRYAIPESKAVAYARDILLSINRTRSGGDSYFCLNTLCNNPDLCILVPSSREAEPLSISVELDDSTDLQNNVSNNKTGWIRTRNRIQLSWRKRFFILTEGTLSFYRYQSPRPHDMRGQTVVTDANISVDKSKDHPGYYVITIVPKDGIKERFLYFNNVDRLLSWAYALECAAKSFSNKKRRAGRQPPRTPASAPAAGSNALANDPSATRNVGDIPHDESSQIADAMREHATRLGMGEDEVEDTLARLSARSFSRVSISVKASTEYKICTTDPQGEDSDTWATLNATFLQVFRITGGRIVRGEEMVQVGISEMTQFLADGEGQGDTPRRKLGRRRRSSG